jgi:hypothetical protein
LAGGLSGGGEDPAAAVVLDARVKEPDKPIQVGSCL